MQTLARAFGVVLFAAAATLPVGAQPTPARGGRPGPAAMPDGLGGVGANPIGATADFLLGRTGELSLTDAQVVRLAAVSRRVDARRKAMMARMDSARVAARPAPGDSAGPRGRGRGLAGPPQAELQQMRDQMRADVRDAIAVLTPDQQATAWMMIAGGRSLGGGGPGVRGGPGGLMGPRFGIERTEP